MGLGPKGHPTFVEGRGPTPSKVGVPPRAPARFGSGSTLLVSIFRTDTLFGSYFFKFTGSTVSSSSSHPIQCKNGFLI